MIIETIKRNHREINVVTSLDIAESFEKRHDNVLKDIRELKCSDEFRLLNFEETIYLNDQKRKMPMYYITRDGFTLLVMGYTGEKVMRFKEAYIRQFNNMERLLHEKYIEREKGTAVRDLLTDALKMSAGYDRNQDHSYSAYTNSIYKAVKAWSVVLLPVAGVMMQYGILLRGIIPNISPVSLYNTNDPSIFSHTSCNMTLAILRKME